MSKDFLDQQASKVMEETEKRFVENNIGAVKATAAGEGALFDQCKTMRHEYGATGKLLSEEEVETAKRGGRG